MRSRIPRSDLYSLGIVLYEAVAGKPPFAGENPVSIAYKQVHENPQPLNQLVADVPKPFEAIVAKLLSKKPEIRYQTAEAVRDDLRRFRAGEPVQALAAVIGTGAAMGVGAAAVVGATTAMPRTAAPPPVAPTGTMPRTTMQPQQQPVRQQSGGGRGGMFAVVGFLALIALIAGGVVLFNALAKDKPPSEFPMPNVVGMMLDDGVKVLQDAGVTPTLVEEADPAVPAGTIGRTDPLADTIVKRDQEVFVYFTAAVAPFALDDMNGKTQQEAIDALTLAGLTVDATITTENDPTVGTGLVIRTDPPAGSTVNQGDVIKLIVSAGPNKVAVPPVEGLSQANAEATLSSEAYGFNVTVTPEASADVAAGTSIRTDPAAGTLADKGSDIVLYVSSGPAKVKVPPLLGTTEAQATAKLTDLGLVPDVSYQSVPFGDASDGRVLAQTPSQGVEVDANSTVKLKVAKALPPPSTTTAPTTTLPPTTTRRPSRRPFPDRSPQAARRRKLRSRSCPAPVRMLSGWNCTPSIGRSRWRTPITIPSHVAVTSRHDGMVSGSITKL